VAESASRDDRYSRLRDELYWRLRERFEARKIRIPNDDDLIGELTSIRYKPESSGKIKVESKLEMKKRGLSSPNKADALMLTEFLPDSAFLDENYDRYSRKPGHWGDDDGEGTGWMSV